MAWKQCLEGKFTKLKSSEINHIASNLGNQKMKHKLNPKSKKIKIKAELIKLTTENQQEKKPQKAGSLKRSIKLISLQPAS